MTPKYHPIYKSIPFQISQWLVRLTFGLMLLAVGIFAYVLSVENSSESGRVFLSAIVFFSTWMLIFGGHWLYWKYFVSKAIREAGELPPLNFADQFSTRHVVVVIMCSALSLLGLILFSGMFSMVIRNSL